MLDFDWGKNINPNTAVDDLVDKFLASRITPPEQENNHTRSIQIFQSLARILLAVLYH
jgi:hypothetical protein